MDGEPMRKRPPTTVLEYDLCDHWHMISDHRCTSYWVEEIVLEKDTHASGKIMFGTYGAGTWRFCRMHARMFNRDRDDT
jgi:hypothetical protein